MIDSSNDTMPMPRDEFRKMTGYNDFTAYSSFKLIGRGGSGSVYAVIRDDTKYAMKIPLQFNPNDDSTIDPVSEDIRNEFVKEADRLNNLSNKCSDSVVTMEDYGTVPFPWIVMEFAVEDLRTAIDKGAVSIRDLIGILHRLDRIHGSGFLHLDIKPENIMRVGAVWKFTDFGLSNPINSVSVSLSKKAFAGTIQYSAPEQISEKKYGCKDHRTDIWQMAIICYEVLAKRKPYDSDDLLEVSDLIRDGGPDPQYVPEEYRSVLSKAFQINKDDRYQHAVDFADALEKCSKENSSTSNGKDRGEPAEDADNMIPDNIPDDMKKKFISAMNGNVISQFNLGRRYEDGTGVKQSYDEAVKWYMKAAEQNFADAEVNLGNLYYAGTGVKQSYAEAVKWYMKAAEQGHAIGQYNLGLMYKNGYGVRQSNSEAAKWYTKAADQGYEKAKKALDQINLTSKTDKKSEDNKEITHKNNDKSSDNDDNIPSEIPSQLRDAYLLAVKGDAKAQNDFGVYYYKGVDVPKNLKKSIEWLTKAAEQGYATAQNNLAYMYRNGKGVEKSDVEAVKWYRKAAEQGLRDGQNNLGYMYRNGKGVEKSDVEAVKWYRKAAEQGYATAQLNLGLMYEKGLGVEQSYTEALKWYRKAADQGNGSAKIRIAELENEQHKLDKSSVKTNDNVQNKKTLQMPKPSPKQSEYLIIEKGTCRIDKKYKSPLEPWLVIPQNVKTIGLIGSGIFGERKGLKKVYIPDSVTTIEKNAFQNCHSLQSVSLPDSIVSIGSYAFAWCNSLKSITIPNSVRTIGFDAFVGCTSLQSVTISRSISTIEMSTFSGCSSLKSVTIPNSVKTIGSSAFEKCTSLQSVVIPDSVTDIQKNAFKGCTSLKTIYVKGDKLADFKWVPPGANVIKK